MDGVNSQQRFQETMRYGTPDRVPLFKEGIREGVVEAWRRQDLPPGTRLESLFSYDRLEEIDPNLEPIPPLGQGSMQKSGLDELRRRLDPDDPRWLPHNWQEKVRGWRKRQHVLLLRIHEGYFLTMGVTGWRGFSEANTLLMDEPDLVHEVMTAQAELAAGLADRILQDVQVDGVIFSEPIAGNHGPLISPQMYADFVLSSYDPTLDVLEKHRVSSVILRTYANARALLPLVARSRINALWACECSPEAMDYRSIRVEYGTSLRLIGGFDTDVLHLGHDAIRQEIDEKVVPLLAEGGFVPLADGRVRENVPFESYAFYRKYLEQVVNSR
jgi:hypothetical protein